MIVFRWLIDMVRKESRGFLRLQNVVLENLRPNMRAYNHLITFSTLDRRGHCLEAKDVNDVFDSKTFTYVLTRHLLPFSESSDLHVLK